MMQALRPLRGAGARAWAAAARGQSSLAAAAEPAPQHTGAEPAPAQPRWLAELGAVRTDWTCAPPAPARNATHGGPARRRRGRLALYRSPAVPVSEPARGRGRAARRCFAAPRG
jgi:hypothetical protein